MGLHPISNAIGPNIVGVPLSVKTLRIPQTQGTKHSISFLGEDRDTGGNYLKRFKYAKGIVCAYFSKENYMHNFPDSAECYVIPKIFRTDNREESIRGWAGRYNGVLPKDCYLQIPEKATKTCYWDDHGEAYPIEFEGPDILLEIKTKMPSTISLYFAAANRDYIISCFDKRPFPRNPIPAVTTTRANNLMYGKYYSFYVSCEDNKVYFLINRGHNINTTLSGIFIE